MQNRERTTTKGFLFGETSGASQQFDHPSLAAQPPSASGPTRATLPSCMPVAQVEPAGIEDPSQMGEDFREWQSMGADFREALSFRDFYKLKQNEKSKGYGGQGTRSYELQMTIGRMYFPTFYGTSKCIAWAWV